MSYEVQNEDQGFKEKSPQQLYKEAKRRLRRNVRLKLKQGYYDNLPEKTKIDRKKLKDDGY